ncbi:hypothetical protein BC938DRAFT_472660 [Jimgerdemannia flammicorona]|uniref:GDP-fucose protein O-fucosyltransferase-domain-containing protein n=1 Tax=Jimgerdemannia flammicorona TaxID=994334 RepID=A0A433Q5M9_9FUNG|nr:hypothetical protein BC938DRAFT_472660 [Jimgerdemannia flammicorona]
MAAYKSLIHPSPRHILIYLPVAAIFMLIFVGLRVSFDDTPLRETTRGPGRVAAEKHAAHAETTRGSGRVAAEKHAAHAHQRPANVRVSTQLEGAKVHHDRFLLLNFMTHLGLNNLSARELVWCMVKGGLAGMNLLTVVVHMGGSCRYEIEHHAYFAALMNRTLIVPTHLHMRGCYHIGLCTIEGHRVKDKSDQEATQNNWGMPITNFFDLAHLSQHIKVITIAEFLQLQLDRNPTLHNIPAALASYNILDDLANRGHYIERYVPDLTFQSVNMFAYLHCQQEGVLTIDDTSPILNLFRSRLPPHSPARPEDTARDLLELDDIVEAPIWGFIDIPSMTIDQEYNMTVQVLPPREWRARDPNHDWINPTKLSVDPQRKSRGANYLGYPSPVAVTGLRQRFSMPDLHNVQILHLDGKSHDYGHHPILFSSLEGRRLYDNVVLDWVRYAKPVWDAYEYAKDKMDWKVGGRPYLTFHIRRGDFNKYGWNGPSLPDPKNLIAAYQRTVADLNLKYKTMILDKWDADRKDAARRLAEWESAVSDAEDNVQQGYPPIPTPARPPAFNEPSPLPLSPYTFIATDEDNLDTIASLSALNGTFLFDLLADGHDGDKENFYDHFYHFTAFGDWLGMVDQLM